MLSLNYVSNLWSLKKVMTIHEQSAVSIDVLKQTRASSMTKIALCHNDSLSFKYWLQRRGPWHNWLLKFSILHLIIDTEMNVWFKITHRSLHYVCMHKIQYTLLCDRHKFITSFLFSNIIPAINFVSVQFFKSYKCFFSHIYFKPHIYFKFHILYRL